MRKLPLALACAALPALAQIRTDGSLGQAAQTLQGPSYLITQQLGKLSGSNLFHSFQTFNLGTGESATFTTSTPGIANVISRVTGGDASLIYGKLSLQAASGTPNFYFINPAGVLFGAGASIDVPGAFHVSTADSLRFSDGSRLHADASKASTFSSAAPEAFGFLGGNRGLIATTDGAVIASNPQQAISLVAGDIYLDNAKIVGSGSIRLAAVGAQALDLGLNGDMPALGGQIQLANSALIGASNLGAQDAGLISLNAGSIVLDSGASVSSFTQAGTTGKGAAILLQATDMLSVSNGANLYTSTLGAGAGGTLTVKAGTVQLDGGGYLYTDTRAGSSGKGGTLIVNAPQGLFLSGGASISSDVNGSGSGGDIALTAGNIDLASKAYVSNAAKSGSGDAGSLLLTASSGIRLDGGAQLLSFTRTAGLTGPIQIQAGAGLELAGSASIANVAIGPGALAGGVSFSLGGDLTLGSGTSIATSGLDGGNAGSIAIAGRNLSLRGGAYISSGSLDKLGSAGSVKLTATGSVSLDGESFVSANTYSDTDGGAIQLRAQTLSLSGGSFLTSTAFDGRGNAGGIDVAAGNQITMSGGSSIGSGTQAAGRGGLVKVAAPSISLSGQSLIYTTAATAGAGDAGNVEISAPTQLKLSEGSLVDSSSYSRLGNAGSISVTAGSIAMDHASMASRSALPEGSGQGGAIRLQASGAVSLANDSLISTSTLSGGDAGLIRVEAASMQLDHASLLSLAGTGSRGRGGNVELQLSGDFSARSGSLGTTTFGSGAGGTVSLQAHDISFDGALSGISAAATAASGGQVGSIAVQASGTFSLSNGAGLDISNFATVANPAALQPTRLSVRADQLAMSDATISADAGGNVAASRVDIATTGAARLVRSAITTEANEGNGGPVALDAGRLLVLDNSILTTSVLGRQGNGGDIDIKSDIALLRTGFIQANTAAAQASGGLIRVNVGKLIASGNSLFVGGSQPLQPRAGVFGLNVIQAAAPEGVSGIIAITSPVLDLSGSLSALEARPIDSGGLGRNPCQASSGSSLAAGGRGGLPGSTRGLVGLDALAANEARPATVLALSPFAPGACR
ncbi:two-partner secretion domain-containing protein [Roseateles sp. NT4]|uniref:two-partner secretion domain-containing protein n=1 Tax=Roseateles sp. NT4 TaxID=3453715 RepID=UPI003EEF25C4